MKVLILGAGAIGGYYGGRMAAAGADVTFLVRQRRADLLFRNGLVVKSDLGDIAMPVKTITRATEGRGFDVILLSCKAYDLDSAIESLRPAAPGALILPLLNGLRHLDALDEAFGMDNVAGGLAAVSVTLEDDGTIRHFGKEKLHVHGPRKPAQSSKCTALADLLATSGFAPVNSTDIMQEMWEKFVLICATAGVACLMRGGPSAIAKTPYGASVAMDIFDECAATATAAGHAPRETRIQLYRNRFNPDAPPANPPSMLRDLERGFPVEADHIVGDMFQRALANGHAARMLRTAYTHLQVYQLQRRESGS